mgnify:CR=1 FL=1
MFILPSCDKGLLIAKPLKVISGMLFLLQYFGKQNSYKIYSVQFQLLLKIQFFWFLAEFVQIAPHPS